MAYLDFEEPLAELEATLATLRLASAAEGGDPEMAEQLDALQAQVDRLQRELFEDLSVWQKVQLSRHPDRPYFLDIVERIFDDLLELHGDRAFGDDPAIVAGFARFCGQHVAVIGHQKGRATKDKVERNFGMAHPEGYRKAVRIMKLAERFRRPVLTFIDTPGAYPGIEAEERGQAQAIGNAISTLSGLSVPAIATVIGEGGSGGALALGIANRVLMLQYATYSVITPEGCASILWRDAAKAPLAAEQLHLLASDAKELGIADEIVPEPIGGAHRHPDEAAQTLRAALQRHLGQLQGLDPASLVEGRYQRFRALGQLE